MEENFLPISKEIISESYPLILLFTSMYSLSAINVSLLSLKENNPLLKDGLGITNLYINIFVYSIGVGIIYTLDTLGSSALGKKQYYLFGLYVHRTRVIAILYFLIISTLTYIFQDKIFLFLGVHEDILGEINRYIPYGMISMLFEYLFFVNFRMMCIIQSSTINTYISIITFLMHFFWVKIFLDFLHLHIIGIGIATIITKFLNFFLSSLFLYIYDPVPGTLFNLNKDVFTGIIDYAKVAINNAIFFLGGWGGYELVAVLCLLYSPFDYSVHLIFTSIDFIVMNLGMSFGTTVGIRIGKAIVSETVEKVRIILIVSYMLLFIHLLLVCVILLIFKKQIISLFSSGVLEVEELTQKIMILFVIYTMTSSTYQFLINSLRGINVIYEPTVFTLINRYFTQVLLIFYFCFYKNDGVYGLWIGICIGSLIETIYLIYLSNTINLKEKKESILANIKIQNNLVGIKEIELNSL